MARQFNQKVKLLKLYELLKQYTDENNPMSTYDIIEKLLSMGINVERKTVYEDIKTLNENGYEIMTCREKTNKYYVEDRNFNPAELRILLDSVQAASFITPKKTAEMVDKISSLAGSRRGELLKKNIVWFDTTKHSNEMIYYNVDSINQAIEEGKQLTFKYFSYDTKLNKLYRKNGEAYTVSPVALIFTDDNYYLVTFSEKYSSFVHYRVDRMDTVTVTNKDISDTVLRKKEQMPKYKNKIFDMYGGKSKVGEFLADITIVDAVTDQFGEHLVMHDNKDGTMRFKANVTMSPTFFAWLASFGKKLRLLGDEELLSGYKEFLNEAISNL